MLYKNDKFIYFTFKGIQTYLNSKGEQKKKLIGMPSNWEKKTESEFNRHHTACAIITGAISNITVIDFDSDISYDSFLKQFPIIHNCKKVKTRKGYHLYFKYTPEITTTTDLLPAVDIRNDKACILAPPTKYRLLDNSISEYIDLGGDLIDMPIDVKELLLSCQKTTCTTTTKPKTKKTTQAEKIVTSGFYNDSNIKTDGICLMDSLQLSTDDIKTYTEYLKYLYIIPTQSD
jgi:hypothetical protein